ncbi:MAG: GNAT family N-acetyltransferase, partial [Leptolyngbya sp. SIO3F4]|nr:GNAT family N-acetyltransferase [Leptolyngbya sp. SIO3F4]
YIPYLPKLGLTSEQLQDIVPIEFLHQAQQQQQLWIAVKKSSQAAPVGFVIVDNLANGWFVVELDVLPEHGRQGIGSALMKQVLQAAFEQSCSVVTLTTFRHVPWTIPFYRRLGFEIVVPTHYTPDIRIIVNHEETYGFSRHVRVVMQCQILSQPPIRSVQS